MIRLRLLRNCIVASVALSACGPSPAPPPPAPSPAPGNDLVVFLRQGAVTWFRGTDDQGTGLDYDLARMFAAEHGLTLRIIATNNPVQRLAQAPSGAMIGAGGIYRPPARSPAADGDALVYSSAYYAIEPVLIYNIDGFRPGTWKDLAGETVGILEGSGIESALVKARNEHPEVGWQSLALPSTEALISQVSDGTLNYAIVASSDANATRGVYLTFDTAFIVGGKQELAWAFSKAETRLRDQVDSFFARCRRDGTLAKLIERYYSRGQVTRLDAGIFQDRVKSLLPQFRQNFERAQDETGVEWRLLAAISYQESQWDVQATSETGVRGLMQLTEETARHLGAVDRLDPQASITAAARYVGNLKDKLPARIQEPDRTWLALAAYNIGTAHLEDARVLAQKQQLNPDAWSAVKKTLPLLALPEYYEDAKFGYARGGMPVAFVDRVRAYYDILLAQQPSRKPRLRMFSEIDNPPLRTEESALGNR
ncbi:MAG TPA: membrane-bound lytic murein transglycosylase MltF [Casimicrobiaceae bacterium]|nr:membrane-bound lytic murein transglycosylase MltF [Casimicrobiaceae bacterium]